MALAADAVLLAHFLFVVFVVAGLPLVLVGAARNWSWVRNRAFRLGHFASIAFVAGEALIGMTCPLTVLERHFRTQAGQEIYEREFLAYWADRLLYVEWPSWAFDALHVAFSLVLIALFVLIPPRWPWKSPNAQVAGPSAS